MRTPELILDEPGTFLFDGDRSTRGLLLNRFALSLRKADNRERFLSDEAGYMDSWRLPAAEQSLVLRRDWTGLLEAGGHLQAILKLAATLGLNLFHIGAHNCGTDSATMLAACPRRVQSVEGAHG